MSDYPMVVNNTTDKPMLKAPLGNNTIKNETLAYIDAYDAVLNTDYAYIAYKETDVHRDEWKVRINASKTTGAVFEPQKMREKAREAAAQGKPWFAWGSGLTPSEGDPREVEFRVHHEGGKPSAIEISLTLRNFDSTAAPTQSVKFEWPS